MSTGYGPGTPREPALRPSGADPDTGATARAVASVRAAADDATRVRLEGVHAAKHAIRFGADLEVVVTPDATAAAALLAELAPDVALPTGTVELDPRAWRELVPRELPSPLLAIARRPRVTVDDVLAVTGLVVVLEEPRHLGNLGAVVRVAAAADVGGVLCLGAADPWHPTAVRTAAGLQFALPVVRADELPATTRPRVALDPDGDDLTARGLPPDALLLVGTERGGLSATLREHADHHVRLPMRPGVSSLNLATAVAAVLYTSRPAGGTVRDG